MMQKILCGLMLLIGSSLLYAVVETYDFDNDQQRLRYQHFIEVLRCPKCQNQNLSGSDSQIAEDLRRRLYELIMEGKSDEEIKRYMVDRYGNFVLYEPPVDKNTLWLWLLPSVFLLIAALVVLSFVLLRKSGKGRSAELAGLSEAEQHSLEELLNRHRHD